MPFLVKIKLRESLHHSEAEKWLLHFHFSPVEAFAVDVTLPRNHIFIPSPLQREKRPFKAHDAAHKIAMIERRGLELRTSRRK